ncbi:MAG: hypothetical protein LQ340_003481 [Diploschistes diacapsis]|nr:MAG: hypothetical protein LQ340_003481 [Diploschistes diacapsis]
MQLFKLLAILSTLSLAAWSRQIFRHSTSAPDDVHYGNPLRDVTLDKNRRGNDVEMCLLRRERPTLRRRVKSILEGTIEEEKAHTREIGKEYEAETSDEIAKKNERIRKSYRASRQKPYGKDPEGYRAKRLKHNIKHRERKKKQAEDDEKQRRKEMSEQREARGVEKRMEGPEQRLKKPGTRMKYPGGKGKGKSSGRPASSEGRSSSERSTSPEWEPKSPGGSRKSSAPARKNPMRGVEDPVTKMESSERPEVMNPQGRMIAKKTLEYMMRSPKIAKTNLEQGIKSPKTGVKNPKTGIKSPKTGKENPKEGKESPEQGPKSPERKRPRKPKNPKQASA